MESVNIMGVRIHRVCHKVLLELLTDTLFGDATRLFVSVNAHAINLVWEDAVFRAQLNRADVTFVDGYGVSLAGRILGIPVGERLTFADWMPELFEQCAKTVTRRSPTRCFGPAPLTYTPEEAKDAREAKARFAA